MKTKEYLLKDGHSISKVSWDALWHLNYTKKSGGKTYKTWDRISGQRAGGYIRHFVAMVNF